MALAEFLVKSFSLIMCGECLLTDSEVYIRMYAVHRALLE